MSVDFCSDYFESPLYSDEYAECPYCHHKNSPGDSDYLLYDENTTEYECDKCDKTFSVDVMVSYSWETSKKNEG